MRSSPLMCRAAILLLPLAILGACGSSVTELDGDATVADLNPRDKTQLCEDVANYVANAFPGEELARIACGFSVSNSESCEADFAKCVANGPVVAPLTANCEAFEQTLANCDVTVDEFATCVEEMVDALETIEDDVPFCSEEALLGAFIGLEEELSTECFALLSQCGVSIQGGPGP